MNKQRVLMVLSLAILGVVAVCLSLVGGDALPSPSNAARTDHQPASAHLANDAAPSLPDRSSAAASLGPDRVRLEADPLAARLAAGNALRVMTRAEFRRRLEELGIDPSGAMFESIHAQRADRGALIVLATGSDGALVAGAKVVVEVVSQETLRHHVGNGDYSSKAVVGRTRRDGVALFANLLPRGYMLGVQHPEYLTHARGGVEVAMGAPTFVEVVLEAPDSFIAGVARDERGGAVPLVMMRARRYTEGGAPFTAVAQSGQDGRFRLGVQSGTQSTVFAIKVGYQDTRLDGVLAGAEDLLITMVETPTVVVSGYVTSGSSGEPFSSFFVDGQQILHSEGVFRVERNVSPTPQALRFSAFGVESRVVTVTLAEEEDVDLGEVQLFGARELNGIVMKAVAEGMEPVAGASVMVTTPNGESAAVVSTVAGAFSFRQLAAEQVLLAVEAVGAKPYSSAVSLLPDQPTYVEVVLANGEYEVTGVITDEDTGEPVPDALVEVQERPGLSAVSDGAGAYQITGIDLEQFTLRASKAGYRPTLSPQLAGSEAGATWDAQLIISGLRIRFSRLGAPVPSGVAVTLWRSVAPSAGSGNAVSAQANLGANRFAAATDADGTVTFDVEDGAYYVQVVDYRLHPMRVVADEANTEWLDIEVPGRTTLTGQIQLANGAPLANTSFWLHSGDQDYSTMFLSHTDAGGGFAIPSLAARPYALSIIKSPTVQSAQHVIEFQGLGAPSQVINVTLPPMTATIHGHVVDTNGIAKSGVQVGVEYLNASHRSILAGWVLSAPDGSYSVPLLEAGQHRVRTAWTNEIAAFSEVVTLGATSNEQVDLVVTNELGRSVTGHMIAADGGPLGGSFQFAVDSQGRQNGNFMSMMDWGYVGPFEIKGLAPGAYTLVFTAMGCVQRSIALNVDNNVAGLVVVMQREAQ